MVVAMWSFFKDLFWRFIWLLQHLYFRGDLSTDSEILGMVDVQTKQWTEMMTKQRKEEWEMLKTHLTAQEDIYKKMFETVSAKQMKDMEAFFAK